MNDAKKFLTFNKKSDCKEWLVKNNKNQVLGQIVYNKQWKKWCFYLFVHPFDKDGDIYFDASCLKQISIFMEALDKL